MNATEHNFQKNKENQLKILLELKKTQMIKNLLHPISIVVLALFGIHTTTNAQSVSGGSDHSIFLCSNGTVNSVGQNGLGQLGIGPTTYSIVPLPSPGMTGIAAISAGKYHSVFLKNDGTVWASGKIDYGQLGDGTLVNKITPVQVVGLTGITAISAGGEHTLFLKNDGTVWGVGYNVHGQLGDLSLVNKTTPVQVSGLSGITAIAAGTFHSLFLKNDGTVWAVGRSNYGQLGNGGTSHYNSTPIQVPGMTGIDAITAGGSFSVFLKSNGTVWTTGENSYGQIGDGTISTVRNTPVEIPSFTGVIDVEAGTHHLLFLKNDATVWAVGHNSSGGLGDGTIVHKSSPVQVIGLTGITKIAAGSFHSLFVKNNGTFWATGSNSTAQLGDGTQVTKTTAVQITGACSGALGTEGNYIEHNILVYPNPCNEYLFIELTDNYLEYANTVAELYNTQGQLLRSIVLKSPNTTIQVDDLNTGIYFVTIKNPKGTFTKKIIKQ